MGTRLVRAVPYLVLFALLFPINSRAEPASGQVSLLLGTRFPHEIYKGDPAHGAQPALSLEGSLFPRRWPVGITGYASAAGDWYEGQTSLYPWLSDWISADYSLIAGELGGGVKKSWALGRAQLAVGSGVMATRIYQRVSRDTWALGTSRSAWGKWFSAEIMNHVGRHTGLGLSARYAWTNTDEFGAGGLSLGLTIGWMSATD